jgi:hypothetical protein
MAVYNASLVDVPDGDGVHVKTAGAKGEKYVYKYVKYFRNDEGKPRNKARAIGKFDPASGKMYPNSNYFDLYNVDRAFPDITVWDYGYSYLTAKVSRDTGLLDCLARAFGEQRAVDIVVMAAYMIREGGAMDGIDDWQQRNYYPDCPRLHTSQSTSRFFASLTAVQTRKFFADWVRVAMGEGGTACYDVTSVSSYAQGMTSVERGYNRDGEDLAQFNLGLFCDEAGKLPLYYNRYNGSLTDKTNLAFVLANAGDVGIKRVKMVVDGGFWDEGCLAAMHGLCDAFTVGMPAYLVEAQALLAGHGAGIASYGNELSSSGMYCVPVDFEAGGVAGRALLYFDSQNHVSLCGELSERINRLKAELAALKRYPKNKLKRYLPYFVLTKHENDGGFDFEVDVDKVEKARKGKGYFLIFSTNSESSPDDILRHYRAKDVAEKMFSQIKCDMDGCRIRTHNEQTTDGKTFVTFIACVIRSYLLNKLSQYLTDNSTSLKKALNQLSNVTIISNAGGFRFVKALSKKQKQILKVFGADCDIVASLK